MLEVVFFYFKSSLNVLFILPVFPTAYFLPGGSTFKESSFLGCIRALTLNGVTLDLEEQAKLTPGVTPGCPGHCNGSASVCHNRGRCMEKNSGYVCDCTHSAYNGPHCKKGK